VSVSRSFPLEMKSPCTPDLDCAELNVYIIIIYIVVVSVLVVAIVGVKVLAI